MSENVISAEFDTIVDALSLDDKARYTLRQAPRLIANMDGGDAEKKTVLTILTESLKKALHGNGTGELREAFAVLDNLLVIEEQRHLIRQREALLYAFAELTKSGKTNDELLHAVKSPCVEEIENGDDVCRQEGSYGYICR